MIEPTAGPLTPLALNLDGPQSHNMSVNFRGPTWRRVMREARALMANGMDGRLALNRLKPCIDSRNSAVAANATLRKEEWILYDEAVVGAYQEVLTGVSDLLDAGLRMNIQNPFGTMVLEYERVAEMSEANVSMYAGTPPQDDRATYELAGVPVPIISKGFQLDERVLEASRMRDQAIDVTNADAASRVVSEMLEKLLFLGGPAYAGYTLGGYTNATGVNTGSLTGSWLTLSTTSPKAIIDDAIAMKTALADDYAFGPYMIYIPHGWGDALDNDYFATTAASPAAVTGMGTPTRSIRERLLALDRISGIRTSSQLTAGVVMVSMNRNVVDVGFGFEPRLIQWEDQGGMTNHFRVISIMTFRIKSAADGKSGVAYYT